MHGDTAELVGNLHRHLVVGDKDELNLLIDYINEALRQSRLIPGVEYIQANRVRTLLMEAMAERMADVDVFVGPTRAPNLTTVTNLTGHPSLTLRSGFRADGTPVSLTIVGGLYREADILTLGRAFQNEVGLYRRRPPRFS